MFKCIRMRCEMGYPIYSEKNGKSLIFTPIARVECDNFLFEKIFHKGLKPNKNIKDLG